MHHKGKCKNECARQYRRGDVPLFEDLLLKVARRQEVENEKANEQQHEPEGREADGEQSVRKSMFHGPRLCHRAPLHCRAR